VTLPDSIAALDIAAVPTEPPTSFSDGVTFYYRGGRYSENEIAATFDLMNLGYEIVTFGGYYWVILDRAGDKTLLLSLVPLESRPYHTLSGGITWENSTIRQYLNGDFYSSFDAADRNRIAETRNTNKDNQWFISMYHAGDGLYKYAPIGGADTTDKIFLLSLEEVVKYFGDSGQLADRPPDNTDVIDDQYNSARSARSAQGVWQWWLRSPGATCNDAAYVNNYGGIIDVRGAEYHADYGYGVRPALWLNP
jgi:hypothetical protein